MRDNFRDMFDDNDDYLDEEEDSIDYSYFDDDDDEEDSTYYDYLDEDYDDEYELDDCETCSMKDNCDSWDAMACRGLLDDPWDI